MDRGFCRGPRLRKTFLSIAVRVVFLLRRSQREGPILMGRDKQERVKKSQVW